MHTISFTRLGLLAVLAAAAAPLAAQQRVDTLSRAKRDSIAVADSIRLVREFEQLQKGAANRDSITVRGGSSGPTNPRLMPDISAVGDFVFDGSPKGSTIGDKTKRADVREVEIAIQAAVDPYFRGDIFLGISDAEKISIEQAFLTTTSLPGQFELRIGRYLMPVGKLNVTHRHDLHTIDYPWALQRLLSEDGLKGTGVMAVRVFAPFGFYQELNVAVIDRFGERPEGLQTAEPLNKHLTGLTYAARLRNYWDLSQSTNVEISGSAMTGLREQEVVPNAQFAQTFPGVNAIGARQSLLGGDITLRWRPLQQGLYKSFILQAEVLSQRNKAPGVSYDAEYLGPVRNVTGGYAFARYQIAARSFVGGRYDFVQTANPGLMKGLRASSGYLEFFPSEFSKLILAAERIFQGGLESGMPSDKVTRLLAQATFALGPHKPHPF
ncbi:MAG: hypothetical protein ABIS00_10985 [Gemmatimonadales bacterium]